MKLPAHVLAFLTAFLAVICATVLLALHVAVPSWLSEVVFAGLSGALGLSFPVVSTSSSTSSSASSSGASRSPVVTP